MKRQIFIGDVQGCHGALGRLLDKLKFDPAADKLRFVGDLVNRGGESLEVLRLVRSLGKAAMTVLGNHDLHMLAYAWELPRTDKKNREFNAILEAPDGPELIAWLQAQPLMWKSSRRKLALVHAGVDPRWGPEAARARAREIEQALCDFPVKYFTHMYGDRPRRWKPTQPHLSRLRAITNVMTRMRLCDAHGRLELQAKGDPEHAPKGFRPWFEHLHPDWSGWTLVFGHWSMLGLYQGESVIGLDSGCVWGGRLTALVVDSDKHRLVSIDCRCR